MSELIFRRTVSVARPGAAPRLLRWICTRNPFYVLSAGLFLMGLSISFGAADTWALMSGLAGYTLLLAVTACLLVRFGNVWDDVRTVLLLVVLLFLATSVTIDQVLVLTPGRGLLCCLGGLLLAVGVSEAVLRGARLRLPALYRAPYYLILAFFFLYPLALCPLLDQPESELLMWGMFAFSAGAGLVFLALLPAIRRGPAYVEQNGSPWRWPLYPWALFILLGLAVPARAFLLCWSMHLLSTSHRLLFGPYFVVPFGLAAGVLLVEMALVSDRRGLRGAVLLVPLGLLILALVGHREDPVYQWFLTAFSARLGGDPVYLTLIASAAFYLYAALRRIPLALEALTAVLASLAVVGPSTLTEGGLIAPRPMPLLLAAGLQLVLAFRGDNAWRCALGLGVLVVVSALILPGLTEDGLMRGVILFHLAILAMLIVGAAFEDALARSLRVLAAGLLLLSCQAAMVDPFNVTGRLPSWLVTAYPPMTAVLLAGYAWLLGHRVSLGISTLTLASWLVQVGWNGYLELRAAVRGLDHILLSLLLFALAVLVSLAKSGHLSVWLARRRRTITPLDALSADLLRRFRGE
jgi:hypothetical protein